MSDPAPAPPSAPEAPERASRGWLVLVGLLSVWLAWWHLRDLGHPYLPGWDEAVHAAVAGNLLRHPLTPTLFDQPFVPYDLKNWQANHVWLHMPPLPFWQAAASLAVGGRDFLWLRLPNLLLLLATVWLTYLLGARLLSARAGALAAVLVGIAPFGWMQVQGYHFGDMTDVSLAFWALLSVCALERSLATGRLRWALLGGLALGAALLCKSALALAPAGAALVLWAGRWLKLRLAPRLRLTQLALFLGPAVLLWQGWDLVARLRWPREHAHEAMNLWNHVFTNYEGHGRSWDALWNDRLAHLVGPHLVLLALAGVAWLTARAWREREGRLALLPLWLLGTFLPLLLVETKVPAILYGLWPALALGLAGLTVHLARSGVGAAGLALAAAPTLALLLGNPLPPGPPEVWQLVLARWAPDLAMQPMLLLQLACFLGLLAVLIPAGLMLRRVRALAQPGWARLRGTLAGVLLIVPLALLVHEGSRTAQGFAYLAGYNPAVPALAAARERLPGDAVYVIEGVTGGRQRPDLAVGFLTGRPAHLVTSHGVAAALTAARPLGTPVLLTPVERHLPAESAGDRDAPALLGTPQPGSGYFVYAVPDGRPLPTRRDEGWAAKQPGCPAAPALLALRPGATTVRAGEGLPLLALWRARGPVRAHAAEITLVPASGAPLRPFPLPEDFPTAVQAQHLHNLAPPGLFWGARALGSDLLETGLLREGEILADGFQIVIPRHTPAGRVRVELALLEDGRPLPAPEGFAWPEIEVRRP